MPLACTITAVDYAAQGGIQVWFNLVASGTYTAGAGGDTLNFSTATQDPAFQGIYAGIANAGSVPLQLDIFSQGGQFTYLYIANIKNATSFANTQVLVLSALGTELTTQSYPAAITGDKITGFALFKKWI